MDRARTSQLAQMRARTSSRRIAHSAHKKHALFVLINCSTSPSQRESFSNQKVSRDVNSSITLQYIIKWCIMVVHMLCIISHVSSFFSLSSAMLIFAFAIHHTMTISSLHLHYYTWPLTYVTTTVLHNILHWIYINCHPSIHSPKVRCMEPTWSYFVYDILPHLTFDHAFILLLLLSSH